MSYLFWSKTRSVYRQAERIFQHIAACYSAGAKGGNTTSYTPFTALEELLKQEKE